MSTIETPAAVADPFAQAQEVLAGGVSASMRINPYLGRPLYTQRGSGAYLFGLDGKRYIDFNMSNGAALLGHDHPAVKEAVLHGVELGIICAAETPFHEELAARIVEIIPAAERVRFSSVGSEVTLVALRIARNATGRSRYLKFDGHFHGLTEPWLYRPDDPLAAEREIVPSSGGVPLSGAAELVMVPWNDVPAFEAAMARHGDELAAVICEPIYFNAGCIRPTPEFLAALRDEPRRHGVLLMFDEVLAAFRMAPGGAQQYLGVTPDLCTLGKAVGGGYPLSVFGGRREIMEKLMPTGDCQHSGTYNGHPTSVAAAIAALKIYGEPGFYEHIGAIGAELFAGMNELFARYDVPGRVEGLGARFGIYFGDVGALGNYRDAVRHDRSLMLRFIRGAIDNGVYFHDYGGGACHHGFCAAMTSTDVREALERLEPAVASLVVAAEAATV